MSSWLHNSGFNRGSSRIIPTPSYDILEQIPYQPVQNIVVNNTPLAEQVQPIQPTPEILSRDDIKDIVREDFFELFNKSLLRGKSTIHSIVNEIIPKEQSPQPTPLSKDDIKEIVKEVLFESFNELLVRDKSTIHTIVNDIIPKEQPLQPAPFSKDDITVIVKELIVEMITKEISVVAPKETPVVATKETPNKNK